MYRYRVRAICTATVEEHWTVTSTRALTDEEIEEAIVGNDTDDNDEAGIEIACQDEEISDEHDRSVVEVYPLEEGA